MACGFGEKALCSVHCTHFCGWDEHGQGARWHREDRRTNGWRCCSRCMPRPASGMQRRGPALMTSRGTRRWSRRCAGRTCASPTSARMPCPPGSAPGAASTRPRAGGWDWRALVENVPHRAAVLAFAIWYGGDLCGFALGQASRRRLNGSRHTITLTFVERRPEPPGRAVARARGRDCDAAMAREYGLFVGSTASAAAGPGSEPAAVLRVHGFQTAWKGNVPVHCEKEIRTMVTESTAIPGRAGATQAGFFKNLLYWIMDLGRARHLEERIRRRRVRPATLRRCRPRALEYLRNYDGPENHGPAAHPAGAARPGAAKRHGREDRIQAATPPRTHASAGAFSYPGGRRAGRRCYARARVLHARARTRVHARGLAETASAAYFVGPATPPFAGHRTALAG